MSSLGPVAGLGEVGKRLFDSNGGTKQNYCWIRVDSTATYSLSSERTRRFYATSCTSLLSKSVSLWQDDVWECAENPIESSGSNIEESITKKHGVNDNSPTSQSMSSTLPPNTGDSVSRTSTQIMIGNHSIISNESALNYWLLKKKKIKKLVLSDNENALKASNATHEVRWLSRSKVLTRLMELRAEVSSFVMDHYFTLAKTMDDLTWLCQLSYLADIFNKMNELSLSLQGRTSTIFDASSRRTGVFSNNAGFLEENELQAPISIINESFENLKQLKN
ncbi:zinc finger BED domain-containing protein 5-like [Aphis craccivora]|uniref:Zinc finger BED domain-containing protein 5-like n=1 Tax=Aphis craccivora TaxID=307492 RepID=A0A6G0Z8K1_APHCR|nr:zinc finger BED domain-containing protein 5-like [Aphis craccivora]